MKRLVFSIALLLALVLGPAAARAQYAIRASHTANASAPLGGGDIAAFVTVGQALAGAAGNADFGAAFGLPAQTGTIVSTGVEITPAGADVPGAYQLDQNFPNPFNPTTTIAFALPRAGAVRLAVYNALGQEVAVLADEALAAGRHEVRWDAAGLPSGLYFYRLRAGTFQTVRTMVLLK